MRVHDKVFKLLAYLLQPFQLPAPGYELQDEGHLDLLLPEVRSTLYPQRLDFGYHGHLHLLGGGIDHVPNPLNLHTKNYIRYLQISIVGTFPHYFSFPSLETCRTFAIGRTTYYFW